MVVADPTSPVFGSVGTTERDKEFKLDRELGPLKWRILKTTGK